MLDIIVNKDANRLCSLGREGSARLQPEIVEAQIQFLNSCGVGEIVAIVWLGVVDCDQGFRRIHGDFQHCKPACLLQVQSGLWSLAGPNCRRQRTRSLGARDGVVSEVMAPTGHGGFGHPSTIQEIKRILNSTEDHGGLLTPRAWGRIGPASAGTSC